VYVPLRVHGHHSLLSGVDSPARLLAQAAALGLPAMALCDVDSLAGLVDLLQGAQAFEGAGRPIPRPLIGAEISDPSGAPGRLVALVEDERGYRNLCKLVTARHLGQDAGREGAQLGGPGDFDLASSAMRHREGLIFLADHPRLLIALSGRVEARSLFAALAPPAASTRARPAPERPRNAHLDERRTARIPRPREEPIESGLEAAKVPPPSRGADPLELLEAARAVGAAALAVPDVYWAAPGGEVDHEVRVAIKHNALLEDLPREWLARAPARLLAPQEVCALYAGLPDARGPFRARAPRGVPAMVARTLEVAERCRYAPPLGGIHLPEVELAPGESAYSRLCALAFDGAQRRYRPLRPEVVRRLDYELSVIDRLGFAPYFLLVRRIADFARERAIPCVGRGSAADSLVAYCLGLSEADPLRYRLPFERFLNPARRDRPDIDLDFCWRRRDEVLEHVYRAFGAHRTAMISTLARFGLRSAFRESALVHGFPPAEVNRWSRRLPWSPPPPDRSRAPLHGELAANLVALALHGTPEARGFPFADERWRRALAAAQNLLDVPRHFGLHPGGVVVSPGPITDFVACQRAAKGVVVTQLDKDAVEAVGLVKMDLLGNRALTTIDDTLAELRRRGIEIDLAALAEDDPATAALLREGRTIGCFQIESPGMRNLLQQTGAWRMDDVIQAVALIRPGPAGSGMKEAYVRRFRGLEEPRAPHPRLTELLWETHGILLYQEDVMQAAALLAGMELAEADLLRRTLQKRHGRGIEPLRERFLAGAAENGVAAEDARKVWELVANFVSFTFCKAHAVTYGRIAYRAAWLKAHHPAVFLTAFLASETGYYDPRVYVEEARRLGVPILGPDVNKSGRTFATEWMQAGGAEVPCLRLGLGQVKGLSQATLERLLASRAARGAFLSLPDLLERCGAHTDEAEHLIQCGALDSFDRTRPEMLWRLHLLRAPRTRTPRELEPLDPAQLAACRATPQSRASEAISRARARTGGWARHGIGLGQAELAPGESAALFPEPETPALVLPGLPDLDARTRGLIELELLGLTLEAHPTALLPCPADARIADSAARGGPRPPSTIRCRDLARFARGRVSLRGWLAATRRTRTSKGEWMRFLTLEDESGIAEVVLFPDVYRRDGHLLTTQGPYRISGVVEDQMGACTLHAERVW